MTQASNDSAALLRQRLTDRQASIGVVGLGYVGLPLLRAFFRAGFPVIGFDVDQEKYDEDGDVKLAASRDQEATN